MIKNILFYILFFSSHFLNPIKATLEDTLRETLLNNYHSNTRPIINTSYTLDLKIGIEIKGLEEFNQKDETATFNLWMTMMWYDDYLTWKPSEYNNINYINLDNSKIWKPDIELYNSASKAKVYNIHDKVKLRFDGHILWVRPASFSFACPLNLKKFPRDTQQCSMTFGSWSFPEKHLLITPFHYNYDTDYLKSNSIFTNNKINSVNNNHNHNNHNITVSQQFTHNEWNIIDYKCDYVSAFYMCCPNDKWSVITFTLELKRNSEKYYLTIINIFILTLVALCVNIIDNQNYYRTYLLIFIPLTIIWVLVSISRKIPVIGYYSKMDKLLMLSFIICELCTFISGSLYIFNVSNYFTKYHYDTKIRPSNKLGINNKIELDGGISDLLNIKPKKMLFREKYRENKRKNNFIKIKKVTYLCDYLIQYGLFIGFIISFFSIYYE